MAELVSLENVTAGYGEAVVLEGASLSVSEGESLAVLGRNGVGKTTLLRTLVGLTTLHAGSIRWRGAEIAHLPIHRRADVGIGWVPQERGIFPSLTVEENLTAAAHHRGPWNLQRVYRLFPSLEKRSRNLGNRLSGGEQQMLAIGRALMLNPGLLLLDEPMEGLAPIVVQDLKGIILGLVAESGMAVIIVEQHARIALTITRSAIVLDHGLIVHRSDSARLSQDPELLKRLLAVA